MGVKYRSFYKSVKGNEYTINFDDAFYGGAATEITGSAIFGKNSSEELSHPLKTKYLNVKVLSTPDLYLEEMLEAEERQWSVELFRTDSGGATRSIFFGYLTSEGATRDLSSDNVYLNFTVLDPIAFLQDLAYVDDSGDPLRGDEQLARVIANSLKKGFRSTGHRFDIVDYSFYDYKTENSQGIEVDYTTGRFLKDVTIDQDQFYDDETGVSESCQSVLLNVLRSLQLCVTQIEGNYWLIHHYLFDISDVLPLYVNTYDPTGDGIADATVSGLVDVSVVKNAAGISESQVIHCRNNQNYYYSRGLEKATTRWEYKYKDSLVENSELENGVPGVSMPNWAVGGDYSEAEASAIKIYKYDSAVNVDEFAARSSSAIQVTKDQSFLVTGRFEANFDDPLFFFNVIYNVGGVEYRLRYFGESSPRWSVSTGTSGNPFIQAEKDDTWTFEFELPTTFDDGFLEIELLACRNAGTQTSSPNTKFIRLLEIDMTGTEGSRTGRTGISTYTLKRSLKAESFDTYLGTIKGTALQNQLLKLSIGTPVTAIKDKHVSETFTTLLEIYNRNKIKSSRSRKLFQGSFFGYLEPSDLILMPDISTNKFVILQYEFDTYSDVGSFLIEERLNDDITVTYVERNVYATTVQPTITS